MRMLAAIAVLVVAACVSGPAYLEETEPTTPPRGYVQWCEDHPEDKGCPK